MCDRMIVYVCICVLLFYYIYLFSFLPFFILSIFACTHSVNMMIIMMDMKALWCCVILPYIFIINLLPWWCRHYSYCCTTPVWCLLTQSEWNLQEKAAIFYINLIPVSLLWNVPQENKMELEVREGEITRT